MCCRITAAKFACRFCVEVSLVADMVQAIRGDKPRVFKVHRHAFMHRINELSLFCPFLELTELTDDEGQLIVTGKVAETAD